MAGRTLHAVILTRQRQVADEIIVEATRGLVSDFGFEQGDFIMRVFPVIFTLGLLSTTALAAPVPMTQDSGAPVGDNENSKTAGPEGPVLLEDFHLIEKLARFDRERIPERVVHARGTGVQGVFVASEDLSRYTKASLFAQSGKETPVLVRFSTVMGYRGSPEAARDPRGFAVKFYTDQGNWDLVGNNLPVFFIRDAIKFPDFVHANKPSAITNIQDPNLAFDFFSRTPESTSMLTYLYSNQGMPASYREMDGFGVHAFRLVTRACERSAPSSRARSICEANRFAPFRLAPVRSASSSHAWSRTARSSFAPTSFVLLSRAARKIALDRLSPERSRPDNLFPVKSAGAATVAAASAASTSARVISAETMSGDDRSTSRIMSCASAAAARRPPITAAPNARFIANSVDDALYHATAAPPIGRLSPRAPRSTTQRIIAARHLMRALASM